MAGRDPAPGALESVRTFVNTADLEGGTEALTSPEALRDHLAQLGVLEAGSGIDDHDLANALEVREALRDLMETNCGHECTTAAADALNRAAGRATLHLRFEPDGSAELHPRVTGVDAAIGRLLAAVHLAMSDGSWERMKACAREQCRWAFYDQSKNHSSRWCSMEVCGNKEKAKTYRRRHASKT